MALKESREKKEGRQYTASVCSLLSFDWVVHFNKTHVQMLGINPVGCEPRMYQEQPRKREAEKEEAFGDRGSRWIHSKATEANFHDFMGMCFKF